MSHPNPTHDPENEYPEDTETTEEEEEQTFEEDIANDGRINEVILGLPENISEKIMNAIIFGK